MVSVYKFMSSSGYNLYVVCTNHVVYKNICVSRISQDPRCTQRVVPVEFNNCLHHGVSHHFMLSLHLNSKARLILLSIRIYFTLAFDTALITHVTVTVFSIRMIC